MDYSFITDNLSDFAGSGLLFSLFLVAVVYIAITEKDKANKTALVLLPAFVLAVFFCPIWIFYMKARNDSEILYRLLWLIPMGCVICYAMVRLTSRVGDRARLLSFAACALLIMVSGKYVYANAHFSKAENVYHMPETVVKICDTIIVPEREVKACFPIEMIQYVRQYTSLVCLTYGRDNLMWGNTYDINSVIAPLLLEETLDTDAICEELKRTGTQYLIVSEEVVFNEDPALYDFEFLTNIDGYDIYLDKTANMTLVL